MSELNIVEPKEITLLDQNTLVKLLNKLLHCEGWDLNLRQNGILVPYQINVPDGGSDGEWKTSDQMDKHDYIPRSWTRYQCKASPMSEKDCKDEVVIEKKGKLEVKPRIKEVLENDGAFVFFCSHHEVKLHSQIDSVIRAQLSEAGLHTPANATIKFLGCNLIANWVNKFPAAIRYVREVTQGFYGYYYSTFDEWGKLGGIDGKFFLNSSLASKINAIRTKLYDTSKSHIIRVNGLSGLGKSRLIYEALKKDEDKSNTKQNSLSESCIYLSYANNSLNLVNFISHIAKNNFSGIVVIDDCPNSIHEKIARIITESKLSKLSVITIFHEPQTQRNDTYLVSLKPDEMNDVVENILREEPSLMARGEDAIKAVTQFAEGFPQIAKLIAEFRRAPTIDELRDRSELFQKFLCRGQPPDHTTLLTAQALSLFKSIGGSTLKLDSDITLIHNLFCSEIGEMEFRRSIEEQKKRKIFQQIADTLLITPRPLAVALAANFIQIFSIKKWKDAIEKISEAGLLSEFAQRLEELEFSENSEAIGKLLLEYGLPFNDAEYLLTGTTGSQIFRALTVLNPSAAIKIVKKIFGGCSIERLKKVKESRYDIIRSLEIMVHDQKHFPDAARLLLKLAAIAENEAWANNAKEAFTHLFNLHLSGTKMPAIQRLRVIKDALESKDSNTRKVAISALGEALNFRHFSRISDTTLGGKRDARQDWVPKNNKEALDYWNKCYLLLHNLVLQQGSDAAYAKDILGKRIAVILQTPLLLQLEAEFKQLSDLMNNLWPEVKDQIKSLLNIGSDLTPVHREALLRWKTYLTPINTIENQIHDIVSKPGWHNRKDKNGEYINVSQEEAENFASELISKNVDFISYLPAFLLGEQQQGFSFGAVIGKKYQQIELLIKAALQIWPKLDMKTRNPSFLRGIMHGLGHENKLRIWTLEQIFKNQELIDLLVPLTDSVDPLDEIDFLRICQAITESRLDPGALKYLAQGKPLRNLTDIFLITQINDMLNIKPETAPILFELLWMHCYGEQKKFKNLSELFKKLILRKELQIRDRHSGWEWHEAAKKLISITDDKEWLKKLTQCIRDNLIDNKSWAGADFMSEIASELFKKEPNETWQVFSEVLLGKDEFKKYIIIEFLGQAGNRFHDTTSPLWEIPEKQFKELVQTNKKLIPLILSHISLYVVEENTKEGKFYKWHPHVLILLQEGANKNDLIGELYSNLTNFSYTGSRVPYLEKRLKLIQDLKQSNDAKLTKIAQEIEDLLKEELERTKIKELNEQVQFNH